MNTFTITDVMNVDGIKPYSRRGNEIYFICPVCGRAKQKCSANPTKGENRDGIVTGVWGCVVCNAGGGPIALHKAVTGLSSDKEAAKDLHRLLGDESTHDLIYESLKEEETVTEGVKVDVPHHDRVYRAMAGIGTLSESHRNDLIKRGLTDQDIKDGMFFDIPNDGYAFCRRLVSEGRLKTKDLDGIAGIYRGYNGKTLKATQSHGFFCPAWTENGMIRAGQVSQPENYRKAVKEGRDDAPKYFWLSSSGKNEGVSSGAQCSFLKGSEPGFAIVTEGTLKAYVAWCLLKRRVTVISVPGVSILNYLKSDLLNSKVLHKGDMIYEAYDMDKRMLNTTGLRKAYKNRDKKHENDSYNEYIMYLKEKKDNIAFHEHRLWDTIKSAGFSTRPLTWDFDSNDHEFWNGDIKGIDDFLLVLSEEGRKKYFQYLKKVADR